METFLLVFIPLFIAIDPIGNIPLFLGLTEGYSDKEKRQLTRQSIVTALAVGIGFSIAGSYLLSFMGITAPDFQIGGGVLLLILSIKEIFDRSISKPTSQPTHERLLGVVPLGIPLIAGPAMMTTLLILRELYSFYLIAMALLTNLFIVYVTLTYADAIVQKFGVMATKAVAKVVAIFLAAIAVMMIRRGVITILGGM